MTLGDDSSSILANFAASQTGTSSELAAADAQAALAEAIVQASLQLNSRAGREIAFIRLYCGPEWAEPFMAQVMRYRVHQNPGALKRMVEAIKALSLSEFMRGVNLNLGGK